MGFTPTVPVVVTIVIGVAAQDLPRLGLQQERVFAPKLVQRAQVVLVIGVFEAALRSDADERRFGWPTR
jgi:hypothetical protein